MIEKILTDLMNEHLGKFIENIDKKQVGATLFRGSVELKNMKLKSTIFDDSPLPFSLKYGQIGRIYLKVPLWDMFKTPLVVQIEDVVGLVQIKPASQWSAEQQQEANKAATQDILEQFEIFAKGQLLWKETARESGQASFTDRLVARILDNLQVSIKNFYFRFEDQVVLRQRHESFSIGVKLKEFAIYTGDSQYKRIEQVPNAAPLNGEQTDDAQLLTFKVAKVEGLSLFCDWDEDGSGNTGGFDLQKLRGAPAVAQAHFAEIVRYEFSEQSRGQHKCIVQNFKVELQLQLNKDIRNPLAPATLKFPQLKANLIIGDASKQPDAEKADPFLSKNINIYQPQILRVLKIVELIGRFNQFKDEALIDVQVNRLTPEEKESYLSWYTTWAGLCQDKKPIPEKLKQIEKLRAEMKQIESTVTYRQIINLRKQALEQLKSKDARLRDLEHVEAQIQKEIRDKVGMGLFMSTAKRMAIENEVRKKYSEQIQLVKRKFDDKDSQISSQMLALISDIDHEDNQDVQAEESKDEEVLDKRDLIDFSNLPTEYERLSVSVVLPSQGINLVNEFAQAILKVKLKKLVFRMQTSQKYTRMNLTLQHFYVQDSWARTKRWPYILGTKMQNSIQMPQNLNLNLQTNAVEIVFESNKDFVACPFHLKVDFHRPLLVVANIPLIMETSRTLSVALQNEKLDFDYFIQMALSHIMILRDKTQDLASSIKRGEYEHHNLSIEAQIQAPIFILPGDIFDPQSTFLRVDLGVITARSVLQKYKKNTDYKVIKDESLLYDRYLLTAQGLSVAVQDPAIQKEPQKLLRDVEVAMALCPCLEPLHPVFPTFKASLEVVKDVSIHLDWTAVEQLIFMKNRILVQLENQLYLLVATQLLKPQVDPGLRQRRTALTNNYDAHLLDEEGSLQSTMALVRSDAKHLQLDVEEQKQSQEDAVKKGSSALLHFKLHSLSLQFEDRNLYEEGRADRLSLLIEVKNVAAAVKTHRDQERVDAEFSVQKLEVTEGTDEEEFSKIAFWHKASEEATAETPREDDKQLKASMQIRMFEDVDRYRPDEKALVTQVDLRIILNHSILCLNMELIDQLIQSANHAYQLHKDSFAKKSEIALDAMHDSITTLQQRNEIKSLDERQKHVIIKRFDNLAQMIKVTNDLEHDVELDSIIETCVEMIKKHGGQKETAQLTNDAIANWQVRVKEQTERRESKEQILQPVYVISSITKAMRIKLSFQTESVEIWLKEQGQQRDQILFRTLVFKLKTAVQVHFQETERHIMVSKDRPIHTESERDYILDASLQKVVRVLDNDIDVDIKASNITIGQTIARSWGESICLLLCLGPAPENGKYLQTDLIEPTSVAIKMLLKEQYKLEKLSQIDIKMKPLNLKLDFKDVDLLYLIAKKAESILEHIKQKNLFKHFSQKMTLRVGAAINEISSQFVDEPESEQNYDTSEQTLITWNDPEYVRSINYEFRDKIMKFDQIKFRKTQKVVSVAVTKLQLEFCDGNMANAFENDGALNMPLVQLLFTHIDFSMAEHKLDNSFNPLQGIVEGLPTQRYKFRDFDLPPVLEVDASFNLESHYFNQITQVFEPFLEPWTLQGHVAQKEQHGLFDVRIESSKLLNVNVTYAMALCLRNIGYEILRTLRGVEKVVVRSSEAREAKGGSIDSRQSVVRDTITSQAGPRSFTSVQRRRRAAKGLNKYVFENKSCVDLHIHQGREDEITAKEEVCAPEGHVHTLELLGNFDENHMQASAYSVEYTDGKFWCQSDQAVARDQVEHDLLMIDLDISGVEKLKNVQIEKNGLFSCQLQRKVDVLLEKREEFAALEMPQHLVLEISSVGNQRKVSFQSQLEFTNHIEHAITLEFRFESSKKSVQVDLEAQSSFRVPLKWYLDSEMVDVYLVPKEDDNNFQNDPYKQALPIFRDITRTFSKTRSQAGSPKFKEGIASQICELNSDFFASVDVVAYCCGPKETEAENALFYRILLRPPLVIENKSMMSLKVFEIDDPNTPEELTKVSSEIPASMSDTLLQLDITGENRSHFKFQFRDLERRLFLSKVITSLDAIESSDGFTSEKFLLHAEEEDPRVSAPNQLNYLADFCYIEMERINASDHFNLTSAQYGEKVFEESSAMRVQLYPKYMLVNKTLNDVYVLDDKVSARSNDIIALPSNQTRVRLSCTYYKDSMEIDLSKIGLTGQITMANREEKSFKQLQFGIAISQAPAPFNKTVLLTVSPRYILVNMLDYPVLVQQFARGSKQNIAPILVSNQDKLNQHEVHLHGTPPGCGTPHHMQFTCLKSRDQLPPPPNESGISQFWTRPFSIEKLNDFQTKMMLYKHVVDDQKSGSLEWHQPQEYTYFHQISRVSIIPSNEQSSTFFVILSNPAVEEYIIRNQTDAELMIFKHSPSTRKTAPNCDGKLPPHSELAFVWDTPDAIEKFVSIHSGRLRHQVSLDKVSQVDKHKKLQKRALFKADGLFFFTRLKLTEQGTKVLEIATESTGSDQIIEEADQDELPKLPGKIDAGFKLDVKLQGVAVSIIDNVPHELIYARVDRVILAFSQAIQSTVSGQSQMSEKVTDLNFTIGNFQIDNLESNQMPVLLGASKLYQPLLQAPDDGDALQTSYLQIEAEERKQREGDEDQIVEKSIPDAVASMAPFLIFKIQKNEKQFKGKIGSIVRFDAIHVALQELFLSLDTAILQKSLNLILNVLHLFEEENQSLLLIKQHASAGDTKEKLRHEHCRQVDATRLCFDATQVLRVNKISCGVIMLGTIKTLINLQVDKKSRIDRDIVTSSAAVNGALYVLAPLLQNFANMSNTRIRFNEMVILEAYISQDMLVKNILDHYLHALKKQIFSIVGSSDLLGNPSNLVGKVGQGFYELARDPLEGMLQGPSGFVKGVGTGIQGAVGGVIGGGFDSVSHLSGSLYSVVKQTTGNEDHRPEEKAEGVKQGVTQGIKGFGQELGKGFGGLFRKPLAGAKQGGVLGFAKGFGTGLAGAIASPVTGLLRAGESVSQGISTSANNFSNVGKSNLDVLDPRMVRIRPPRRIDHRGQISLYSYNLAIVNMYLALVQAGALQEQQVRSFELLLDMNKARLLLVTTEFLLLIDVLNFKELMHPRKVKAATRYCFKLDCIKSYDVSVGHLSSNEQPVFLLQIIYQLPLAVANAAGDWEDRSHSLLTDETNAAYKHREVLYRPAIMQERPFMLTEGSARRFATRKVLLPCHEYLALEKLVAILDALPSVQRSLREQHTD